MSECVVRMKNPDDCLKCGVMHICNPYVDYWQQDTRKKPKPGQKGCLIICQLPEGHGRLVDADELIAILRKKSKEFSDSKYGEGVKCGLADARDHIAKAQTIVPAAAERSET